MAAWPLALGSLRGRLTLTYAGLALLAVAVSSFSIANILHTVMLDRISVDLLDEDQLLAERLAEPLARADHESIARYVSSIDSVVTARIIVVDLAGDTVAVTDPAPSAAPNQSSDLRRALEGRIVRSSSGPGPTTSEVVHVALPVRSADGRIVGAVRASYNLEDVQDVVSRVNMASAVGGPGGGNAGRRLEPGNRHLYCRPD